MDPATECLNQYEVLIPLPDAVARRADIPFTWVLLNWNPHGHISPGVYDVPHFDVHFYMVPIANVLRFRTAPVGLSSCAATSSSWLGGARFDQCLTSDTHAARVQQGLTDGRAAGVQGTPGFVVAKTTPGDAVEGTLVVGAQPVEVFRRLIDELLAEK